MQNRMRIKRSSRRRNRRKMRKGRKVRQKVCNVCRVHPEIQTIESSWEISANEEVIYGVFVVTTLRTD